MENDEPDSRNVAFKRFRDADPNDSSDSDDGSGHKRRRISAQPPKQGPPPGVTTPSDTMGIDSTVAPTGHVQGMAPARFNWNAGTKTTIGTSLKNRKRTNIVGSGIASSSTDAGQWIDVIIFARPLTNRPFISIWPKQKGGRRANGSYQRGQSRKPCRGAPF